MEFRGGEISFLIRYRRRGCCSLLRKSISTARPREAAISTLISLSFEHPLAPRKRLCRALHSPASEFALFLPKETFFPRSIEFIGSHYFVSSLRCAFLTSLGNNWTRFVAAALLAFTRAYYSLAFNIARERHDNLSTRERDKYESPVRCRGFSPSGTSRDTKV